MKVQAVVIGLLILLSQVAHAAPTPRDCVTKVSSALAEKYVNGIEDSKSGIHACDNVNLKHYAVYTVTKDSSGNTILTAVPGSFDVDCFAQDQAEAMSTGELIHDQALGFCKLED